MKLFFAKLALEEMAEAKRYYERQQPGLGDQFQLEAQRSALRILEQPLTWRIEIESIRRCLLNRFPYKMLYVIREENIVVLAVAHQHRKPDYWIDRIPR